MDAKQKCFSDFYIENVVRYANEDEGQERGLATCNMYETHVDGSVMYGEENRREIVEHIYARQ